MTGKIDWVPIRTLARRVLEQGEPLELTDKVHALLRRSAREVAIPAKDVEKALHSLPTATALLRKISRRIRVGSRRLMDAKLRADRLSDAGNLKGAREQIAKALAVEVVPLYRKHAKKALANLARLQKVATSGRVDPKLSEHSQLFILLHRLDQGKHLKPTKGMRAFLRHAAAEVGISEAETKEDLASQGSAGALLRKIVERRRKGRRRLERALLRMMDLRDAGDLEGARQQMRDLLAVEVVPVYRQAAEENLAGLEESPPTS
ncbi:DUSAM domain-containing protein [Stigmatella sp. ncwal1]|uniref:DUSAM domain-containing protein n=1 Tax=Stigmatella ashevillensis TaxID=2995309 RepID=A0ABT5DIS3_9BACT|nr:DUSAM domain-containing protein [Stigmatella ashevillena]MDC0713562.1 DUSAM domain-containing protein [Stigmatella ashevillena]